MTPRTPRHLPVAAFGTWIWGAVATFSVLATLVRLDADGTTALQVAGAVGAIWVVAAVVSIATPSVVTGSDPTQLPIACLVAPVAAAVLTAGTCGFVTILSAHRRRG